MYSARWRWIYVIYSLPSLFTAYLCFVPLFNLLAYEFCFALGLLCVLSSTTIGYRLGQKDIPIFSAALKTMGVTLLHLLLPLLIMSLNALRVKNCDYVEGLEFFFLLPVASAMYAASCGYCVAYFGNFKQKHWRISAVILVVFSPLLYSLWLLYWEPPIFAFDHMWGHFAGSLYDEAIQIDSRLWLFRMGTLMRIGFLWGLVFISSQRTIRISRNTRMAITIILILIVTIFEKGLGPRYGFRVLRSDIQQELSKVLRRPGIIIHLPSNVSDELSKRIADEHAFRIQQLCHRLQINNQRNIHSYVYRDRDHKARWMGGRNTMVAKPWLNEIHIHDIVSPHPILAHELVHALAANFSPRLMGACARHQVLLNMSLVEGLAEALTPERSDSDLHHFSKAMRDMGKAPDIRSILGPVGFWTQASRRAYTVAGSFVRYLLEQYGPAPLKQACQNGTFSNAFPLNFEILVQKWEQFIDSLTVSEFEKNVAQEYFRRPSIFHKTCAHEVAQLRRKARQISAEAALPIYQQIIEHLDGATSARYDWVQTLFKTKNDEAYLKDSTQLLGKPDLSHWQRMRLLENRGNIFWNQDHEQAARDTFQKILSLNTDLYANRLQWVKLWAMRQNPLLHDNMRAFLTQKLDPLAAVSALEKARSSQAQDKTIPYLIGRQLYRVKAWDAALENFHQAATHPFSFIESERLRLIGTCYQNKHTWKQAEIFFSQYALHAPTTGERARALDTVEYIRWLADRK